MMNAKRRWISIAWALAPLLLGIPAVFSFGWAAHRLHSKALAIEAAFYGVTTVLFTSLSGQRGELGGVAGGLDLALMVVATTRAFMVRDRVFYPIVEPVASEPPEALRPIGHRRSRRHVPSHSILRSRLPGLQISCVPVRTATCSACPSRGALQHFCRDCYSSCWMSGFT